MKSKVGKTKLWSKERYEEKGNVNEREKVWKLSEEKDRTNEREEIKQK